MNDSFIVWSFPLIVLTIFLLATVSKPEMPHIQLPETDNANQQPVGIDWSIPIYQ